MKHPICITCDQATEMAPKPAPNVVGFLRDAAGQPADHWRERFKGATCFLVCGGPSLNSIDLTQLNRRGCLIAAVNQCGATHVRPHLWFSVDSPSHFHQAIWADPAIAKFGKIDKATLPTVERKNGKWVQCGDPACNFPNTWFFKWVRGWDAGSFFERTKVVFGGDWKMPSGPARYTRSVMLPAIRLLYWMGVRTIILVGCDFNMTPQASYAFDDPKDVTASGYNNTTFQILNEWFRQLHPVALSYGLRIFNANPESKLDGFPKLSYDDALRLASADFPAVETVRGHYRA